MDHAIEKISLAGGDVTLCKLLQEVQDKTGLDFAENSGNRDIAMEQKNSGLCFVAQSVDEFEAKAKNWSAEDNAEFTMPDGSTFEVQSQAMRAPEIMFQPKLIGRPELGGVHALTEKSISLCAPECQSELYRSVVLSGGNTMFAGFHERLQHELKAFNPDVKVIADATRMMYVFMGAAVMCAGSSFPWIKASDGPDGLDYKTEGSRVITKIKDLY